LGPHFGWGKAAFRMSLGYMEEEEELETVRAASSLLSPQEEEE